MPACPSSMLKLMQAIDAIPIAHNSVSTKLERITIGSNRRIKANALQTTMRTPLSGRK